MQFGLRTTLAAAVLLSGLSPCRADARNAGFPRARGFSNSPSGVATASYDAGDARGPEQAASQSPARLIPLGFNQANRAAHTSLEEERPLGSGFPVQRPVRTSTAPPGAFATAPAGSTSEPSPALLLPAGDANSASRGRGASAAAVPSFATWLAALAIVLGVFFLLAWLLRKLHPRGAGQLPVDVVEVLGRTALAPRQVAQLIRVGNKLLLVAVTAGESTTLTEITDPGEVHRLVGMCKQPSSFRQVFQQFSGQRTAPLTLEVEPTSDAGADLLTFERRHV